MTSPSTAPEKKPLLQQAPVAPRDASGLIASVIGFALFATCTGILSMIDGATEWFYVVATGTVIGLILILITAVHRYRRVHK
jgi:lipoprotein signal peptidase